MSDDDKTVWREWAYWDKKRFAHETALFEKSAADKEHKDSVVTNDSPDNATQLVHVPKKRRSSDTGASPIPKKRK